MEIVINILQVIHIITAILLAWPFYALVVVNQRGRLGPPLGDRADTYMENIIKNRTIPCFVFQGTVLVTGLALVLLRGLGFDAFVNNPILGLKLLLLLLTTGLLAYVHTSLQPRIDAFFAQAGSNPISQEIARQIGVSRVLRKRVASICMFVVLTIAMLGVQVWAAFPLWLTIVLVIAIGVFTWRTYSSVTSYGWF